MERIGATLRLLTSRGFKCISIRKRVRLFEGFLACLPKPIKVSIEIRDWDFLDYPVIKLHEHPENVSNLLPHVDDANNLCYFAPNSIILDRYNPATAIAQCLDAATEILSKIATDPQYQKQEVQSEFLSYWLLDKDVKSISVIMGPVRKESTSASYYHIGDAKNSSAIIGDDYKKISSILDALHYSLINENKCRCLILKANNIPIIPESGLFPRTIKELFDWLKVWDKKLYNNIQYELEKNKEYLDFKFISFIVNSPVGKIGFGFDLDQIKRLGYKKKPHLYKQYLHGKGGYRKIFRLHITDLSPSFIHSRNLSYSDLNNKRIILIGCGAIGGFLAHSLVRLGAGSGETGSLELIDHDIVGPENLGRHYLGYPALFKDKADALAKELKYQFPLSSIIPKTERVIPSNNIFNSDLIIDATGMEAVSEMLNEYHVRSSTKSPILYVWIKGNGEATQALWVDDHKYGCFRCLRDINRVERFKLLNNEPELRFLGCQSFTPYAVSSPMSAASLAIDMIIDWLKGDPAPRFRTRTNESADIRKLKNQNISRLNGCPACDRH